MRHFGAYVGVAFLMVSSVAHAATTEVGPTDNVEAAMNALAPGDELVLQGGTYTLTDAWHITLQGTQAAPILVRAKTGEHPHLDRPLADQNIIDFDLVRYAELRGIEFSGGSAGLRLIDVSFMTVRDCEVHGTADVAIAANSGTDYEGLQILHNHIHDTGATGEGMYIGCNSNACRVHGSLFVGNYIHHTNGPTVTQGDGIEIKEGSYDNIVRDNVIHDTGYPCIITYSTVGNGGPNIIERNVMWNCGDHGIQSAADVVIRNNIILGSVANGIANQPHQAGTPSNIQIVHNTILHPAHAGISSSGITGSVLIANNAIYAAVGNSIAVSGDLTQVVVDSNVGMGALSGVTSGLVIGDIATDFVSANFSGVPPNDVFPAAGSKLIGAGNAAYVATDDFNGTLRNGVADVGAYLYLASGNPGWTLTSAFKDGVASVDGGAGGASGTGGGGGAGATGGSPSGNGGATSTSGGAAGKGGETAAAKDYSGCGCRVGRDTTNSPRWALLAALAVLRLKRRARGPLAERRQ